MSEIPSLRVATRNANKTEEIAQMLEGEYKVQNLINSSFPEVKETGTTFIENATLKAVEISKLTSGIVLSDDSGLEVDALNGAPGVYSSSYGGEEGNHAKNNQRLIKELNDVMASNRSARFRCVMVLAQNGEVIYQCDGKVEGSIISELSGTGGFGYDPLFIPEDYTETFAELGSEVKNTLSHRGKALQKIMKFLSQDFK